MDNDIIYVLYQGRLKVVNLSREHNQLPPVVKTSNATFTRPPYAAAHFTLWVDSARMPCRGRRMGVSLIGDEFTKRKKHSMNHGISAYP